MTEKKKAGRERTLKDLLADEDGFVSKETILKLGMASLAGISLLGSFSEALGGHTSHNSHVNTTGIISGGTPDCPQFAPTHSNMTPHASHASY